MTKFDTRLEQAYMTFNALVAKVSQPVKFSYEYIDLRGTD